MGAFSKVYSALRREGFIHVLREGLLWLNSTFGRLYNRVVRRRLPKRTLLYNGVPVPAGRWGDGLSPWPLTWTPYFGAKTDWPEYESGLIDAVQREITRGDAVLIIGAGWGVSMVAAATQVGEHGTVIGYEAGREWARDSRETLTMNEVTEVATINRAVVEEAGTVRGQPTRAPVLPADTLPPCDALVLDCEGAETAILRALDCRPETVIVETHGNEDRVRTVLQDQGYTIANREVAECSMRAFCEHHGIFVLTAIQGPRQTRFL